MTCTRALHAALHRMLSVKLDYIEITGHKIETCRRGLSDDYAILPFISDDGTARDDIGLREHAVEQAYLDPAHRILQRNLQRVRLIIICPYRGQPLQSIFSFHDLIAGKEQIAALRAVAVLNIQRAAPVIARPERRVFLRKRVQRIGAVAPGHVRIAGKAPVRIRQQIVHGASGTGSIV